MRRLPPRHLRPAGILARCALTLLVTACASVRAGGEPEAVRVLVYNVHAGKDASAVDNLDRVARIVRETEADVVLLQEIDRGTRRSGEVDQLAELRRRTGFHGAFGKTLDYQGGEYGIAVLSRWPIVRDTLVRLPVTPPQERAGGSYEPRGALVAWIDAPGLALRVLDTHLDASRDDHYRRQEAAAVVATLETLRAAVPDGRRVLALAGGDFNAEPGTATHRIMTDAGARDAWLECGAGEGLTFPSVRPVKRIDYLFITGAARCTSARVLESDASDHRALLVTVVP